ncbi:MAG: lactate utilization protein [Desulfobacterales bacterium]|nr:lactate utilization protein [Desulfobacterales bacterium]
MADNQYQTWLWEQLGHRTIENLKKNGFAGNFLSTAEEAGEFVTEMVREYNSFGFGGSATARELNLPESLKQQGKTVYDHWDPQQDESDLTLRLKQGRCDCFICSANAISATGEIVNVDGVGNRTNAMTFGCPNVVIVAGMNKVALDIDGAIRRIREIAGPMRARSLNMNTPCAETGICTDCNSPQRICRITTILHRKPMMTEITVVLINQALGF